MTTQATRDEEVFRFVAVRPPQRVDTTIRVGHFPRFDGQQHTPLHTAIRMIEPGPTARQRAEGFAAELMASSSYVFHPETAVDAFRDIRPLVTLLTDPAAGDDDEQLTTSIIRVLKTPVADFVASERFAQLRIRFWDSYYANVLLPAARPYDVEDIVEAIRVLHLLKLLADSTGGVAARWRSIASASPVIPVDLVPGSRLPSASPVATLPTSPGAGVFPEQQALAELDRLGRARHAVVRAQRRSLGTLPAPSPDDTAGELPAGGSAARRVLGRITAAIESPTRSLPPPSPRPRPWMIGAREVDDTTRAVLADLRIDLDVDSIPDALGALDRAAARHQSTLLALATDPGFPAFPGGVRPTPGTGTPYRVLGFGDLEVVRQTLLRYEAGEIAHIENVMQTEERHRSHTWRRRTEERVVIEDERIEERERDLQTTERFELQHETERTIQTDLSVNAGVSVTGKYGPVEVTASGDFAYSSARSESERNASTFARDITERAVDRVTTRVREERLRRTVEEIKEVNSHGFVNTAEGASHVRGIYQWVDKVYQARIVNYGQRLMLEFVIPEPAAFHLFARCDGGAVVDGAAPPPPPVVPVLNAAGDAFLRDDDNNVVVRPLQPSDLVPEMYEHWVSAYGVTDADPPPPESVFVGKGIAKQRVATNGDQDDPEWAAAADEQLIVPAGYIAVAGWMQATTVEPSNNRPHNVFAIAGRLLDGGDASGEQSFVLTPADDPTAVPGLDGIDGVLPVTYRANAPYFAINIVVHCRRTPTTLVEWQLATFASVMTAYRSLQQAYDDVRRRTQRAVEIVGGNPVRNAQVVREELQKSCITLVTDDRFDTFNAVQPDATTRYPELDLTEVRTEGSAIRFLEQAFEWTQMTYLFYPYFWGRKTFWREQSRLDDVDPAFGEFLRAGAARVVVPVRPGAEAAVALFLGSGGGIAIDGGTIPVLDDELALSIADELRARQGVDFIDGPGVVNVVRGSRVVTGLGTEFDPVHDVDRELIVDGNVARIREVVSATQLLLADDYPGDTQNDLPYGLGPRLVGLPWEVRVPTSLVYLREEATLPDWTAERAR